MAKKFMFRGLAEEQIRGMSIEEFSKIVTSRERRMLRKGFTEPQRTLLKRIKEQPEKFHKTHERNIVIIPQMLGAKLGVYSGKAWATVDITPDKLGHRLGEFVMTRQRVKHSAPGIGASRSSKHVSIK